MARMRGEERLSVALGWFSIGLGLAEVMAPDAMARLVGIPDTEANRRMLRAFGAREIASGVGILSRPRGAHWLWSRVGGDFLDLAYLARNLGAQGARPERIAAATAAVAGVTALDVVCGQRLSRH